MLTIGILISLLAAFTAETGQLPIQVSVQEQWDWCWAAASESLLNRYLKYPGIDVEGNTQGYTGQCLLVNRTRSNPTVDCCSSPTTCSYTGPYAADVEAILESSPYYLGVSVRNRTLSDQELTAQINTNKRPVLAILRPKNAPSGTKHMVVITAIDSSGSLLTIMDPGGQFFGWYNMIPSSELRGGTGNDNPNQWEWYDTITVDANPPADVKLRYSFTDATMDYNYISSGNMTGGPDFRIDGTSAQTMVVPFGKSMSLKQGFAANKGSYLEIFRE